MLHRHRGYGEAAARIAWGVANKTICMVTGEVGTGKTVAVRAAAADLDPARHTVIYLPNPSAGVRGILATSSPPSAAGPSTAPPPAPSRPGRAGRRDSRAGAHTGRGHRYYRPPKARTRPFDLRTCGRDVPWLFTDLVGRPSRQGEGGCVARRVVIGDLRVQRIERKDGGRSWTIVTPDGGEHGEADRFLREHDGSGTQRTYAYLLVDHLRWLHRERLTIERVGLRDLERYMGLLGADVRLPLGEPWRQGKRPYGPAALSIAAACVKGFYLHQASLGVNSELGKTLDRSRLPSRADRRRRFLGHVHHGGAGQPARAARAAAAASEDAAGRCPGRAAGPVRGARSPGGDWLATGAFGSVSCAGCTWSTCTCAATRPAASAAAPHLHVCHRPGNPNRAEAKTKHPWRVDGGTVGGLIKRVSPAMIHTYFEYITTEYPRAADHGMLLVQLHGDRGRAAVGAGRRAADAGPRGATRRAGRSDPTCSGTRSPRRSWMPPAAIWSSPGTPAGGPRRRWWTRSTATPMCTTPPSTPRCAASGVSSSDGAKCLLPLLGVARTASRDRLEILTR